MTEHPFVEDAVLARMDRFPDYIIGIDGSVFSYVHYRPRLLKPIRFGKYLGVTLRAADGAQQRAYIHGLVAEAFHGPRPDGMEVRHLDGDRLNNDATNLRWGTRSQNMRDKERHGTAPRGERHPHAKLTDTDVREIRRMRDAGASLPQIMRRFNISRMTAWRVAARKLWRHVQ